MSLLFLSKKSCYLQVKRLFSHMISVIAGKLSLRLKKSSPNSYTTIKKLPHVLNGKGYGIIEDYGGTVGLERIALAFNKKEGQEYEQYCEWLGTNEFDLKIFDADKMNLILQDSITDLKEFYEGD